MIASARKAEAAVVIAVSGERRSWEIACRIAVRAISARFAGLGLGGLLGDPLALDRDVDQPAQRLGEPLDLTSIPTASSATYSHTRALEASLNGSSPAAWRRYRLDDHARARAPVACATRAPMLSSCACRLVAGEDRRRRLGQQRRLALAGGRDPRPALGLRGALAARGGQPADDDGGDQEHDQLDHVLGVRDRELVARRDEEVVERQDSSAPRPRARPAARGGSPTSSTASR